MELAAVPETRQIMVFGRSGQSFAAFRTIDFDFQGVTGLGHMRQRLRELAGLLPEVKSLVSRGYPGLSMEVLTRAGFNLYRLDGFDEGVLPAIAENDLTGQFETELAPKAPVETEEGSGEYFLDLREALSAYPELTSKKILRPFFDSATFMTLKVIHDHLPPWLPPELKARGYGWDGREIPGGYLVEISPSEVKPCRP
jgi:hypothetical protein